MNTKLMGSFVGLVFALSASMAQAIVITNGCADANNSCTLEELLFQSASITVNDKVFDGWSLNTTAPPINAPDFSTITVSGLDNEPNNPGISYDFGFWSVEGPAVGVLNFSYTVSTTNGLPLIKDNSLEFGGLSLSRDDTINGDPTISIDEFVSTALGGDLLGEKFIFVSFDDTEDIDSDSAVFSPQSSLFINTNIGLNTVVAGDIPTLSGLIQRFSQVPEPTTLALLGIGIAGLGFTRRRTK